MAMASLGYLVLVPELFAFGEAKRRDASEETDACTSCSMLESHLLNCGLSLAGLRVFEAMKTLDFAEAAFGVHAFGAYGISGGGHVCNYTGVLEDRVEAVMLSGYPNLYKYSILAMDHCICNYVPGQLEAGESHQVTALAAPKKLLAMNGRKDPIFLCREAWRHSNIWILSTKGWACRSAAPIFYLKGDMRFPWGMYAGG